MPVLGLTGVCRLYIVVTGSAGIARKGPRVGRVGYAWMDRRLTSSGRLASVGRVAEVGH